MKKIYKIGVYRNAGSGWHGGQIYFDNLIALLSDESNEAIELVIIEKERADPQEEKGTAGIPTVFLSDYLKEEREKARQIRKEAKRSRRQKRWWQRFLPDAKSKEPAQAVSSSGSLPPELAAFASIARDFQLDFVFPLPASAIGSGVKGAGWIPDLQHCFLPELFEPAELKTRNEMFQKLSDSGIVVFSSETSRDEFRVRYPGGGGRIGGLELLRQSWP